MRGRDRSGSPSGSSRSGTRSTSRSPLGGAEKRPRSESPIEDIKTGEKGGEGKGKGGEEKENEKGKGGREVRERSASPAAED